MAIKNGWIQTPGQPPFICRLTSEQFAVLLYVFQHAISKEPLSDKDVIEAGKIFEIFFSAIDQWQKQKRIDDIDTGIDKHKLSPVFYVSVHQEEEEKNVQ